MNTGQRIIKSEHVLFNIQTILELEKTIKSQNCYLTKWYEVVAPALKNLFPDFFVKELFIFISEANVPPPCLQR